MVEIQLPTSAKQDEILNAVKTSGKVLKSKVFDVPGTYTWKTPKGVIEVYLTGCGAGGGGGGGTGANAGSSGGVTSFGSLLSLSGGAGGGMNTAPGVGAGSGAGGTMDGIGGAGFSGGNAGRGANGATGDGGGSSSSTYGGGGAGDYKTDYPVTVTENSIINITIGTGGTGGTNGAGTGGNGILIIKWWE